MKCRLGAVVLQYRRIQKIPVLLSNRAVTQLSFKVLTASPTESDKPPIIILHGLLGTKRHWESMGKTLVNMTKRPVVTVDLRNHGDSPHVFSHKYKEVACDVLHLYEKLSIDKASLIGHSIGGRTCMCIALMAPEKVASILVVDMSPVSNAAEFAEFYPVLLQAMSTVNFKDTMKVSKALRMARHQLKHVITNDQTMYIVLSNVKKRRDGSIGWACNLEILIKHFKYIMAFPKSCLKKQYQGPALFIGGQVSDYIPPDDLPGIRDLFPQAVITYIKGAGHNVHVDDPRTFLEYVIGFLRSNN